MKQESLGHVPPDPIRIAVDFAKCTDPNCPATLDRERRYHPKYRGPHAHPVYEKDQP